MKLVTDINLAALDGELCRIPGVVATRFVNTDPAHLSATILVTTGTDVSRVLRDAAVVAGVHCQVRLDADRIVVMQVGHPAMIWPPAPPLAAPEATQGGSAAASQAAPAPWLAQQTPAPVPGAKPAPEPTAPAPSLTVARPPAPAPATTNGEVDAEEALASAQRTVAAMLEQLSSSASNP